MKKINFDDLLDETHELADFHDAKITIINIDYMARKALFTIDLYIGNIHIEAEREKRARGILTFEQLQYFVAEPPDGQYNFEESEGLTISSNGIFDAEKYYNAPKLPKVEDDAFVHWLYILEWNSCIYISAKNMAFVWQ